MQQSNFHRFFYVTQVWPNNDLSIAIPPCPICGLKRPLIFQIYAPLEHSPFHRTLYIFTCIQATCSNQSKSWICVRVQQLEKVSDKDTANIRQNIVPSINWCNDANDWGDADDVYSSDADNCNEQNGNIIKNDNRLSDEDDESNSMESDPIPVFGNLQVDDKNANCGAQGKIDVRSTISLLPNCDYTANPFMRIISGIRARETSL